MYDRHRLCRPRALFGHGVHLTVQELATMHRTGAAIAHCPTPDFFLGSGCLDIWNAMRADRRVRVGLGTDLGVRTSFSALLTLNEASKAAPAHRRRLIGTQGRL